MKITRRKFDALIMTGAATLSLALAAGPAMAQNASGVTIPVDQIGVVTGSLGRSELTDDTRGTMQAIAECGIKNIEWSFSNLQEDVPSFTGVSLTDILALSNEFGIGAPSLGVGAGDVTERFDLLVEIANDLGASDVRISGVDKVEGESRHDYYSRLAAVLNEAGAALAAEGITLSYHNHEQEFLDDVGDGMSGYDLLLAEVDPANAGFQLDIGWSAVGGADPAALMRDNPGRFHMLHVRDLALTTDAEGNISPTHTPVGEGDMDWEAIFAASEVAGVRWFIVELSGYTGVDASCDAIEYLTANFTQ